VDFKIPDDEIIKNLPKDDNSEAPSPDPAKSEGKS